MVTAKALLDKNPNPTVDEVKDALAGHICRCAAYPAIIRTVIDSGGAAGSGDRRAKRKSKPRRNRSIQIKLPMVRDFSTGGGHLPGDEAGGRREKTVTKKWQGYPPENLNVIGKPMPALSRGFHSAIHGQSAVRQRVSGFPICCT